MKLGISEEIHSIMSFARDEAMRTGCYEIGPDHIFLAIIRDETCDAHNILIAAGIRMDEIKGFIDEHIFTNKKIAFEDADKIGIARSCKNLLNLTVLEAARFNSVKLSSLHLLLALCRVHESFGCQFLETEGLRYEDMERLMVGSGFLEYRDDTEDSGTDGGSGSEDGSEGIELDRHSISPDSDGARNEGFSLKDCCRDLTKEAAEGAFDPVIGRRKETGRIMQILGRRKKHNAILVGTAGVGKSSIVEGIANAIASGKAPQELKGKTILSLDIASVLAGTRYRGDLEKRIKSAVTELAGRDDVILFIDELQSAVGTGGTSGGHDAAGLLKPYLENGELQCIATSDPEGFSHIIEKDSSLSRCFQKVEIEPTDSAETIEILKKLKERYETHHKVKYSDDSLTACVELTGRYISDRVFPDKAIDALDEAGSMVKLRARKSANPTVSAEDIAAAVSLISGIPLTKVAEKESEKLLNMESRLKQKVIGQEEAVRTVARAIRRSRSGIGDPQRPIGSFLFLGRTGVGKTHLAKALAEEMFGSSDCLIRIDMSEYAEKFTVSRLVGAPPGYVGFNEGGQLTEAVKRKPYSVILLDEIEKAHPDMFNLLLQVMDEGRLTDSSGYTVSLRNCILIMTSNAGSREVESYGNSIGYGFGDTAAGIDRKRQKVVDNAIKRIFPPEFINRIDEQVFFRQLDKEDIMKILDLEVAKLRQRIKGKGYRIVISPDVKSFVAETGYDPSYGARPLRRAVRQYIEDPIAEYLLRTGSGNGAENDMADDWNSDCNHGTGAENDMADNWNSNSNHGAGPENRTENKTGSAETVRQNKKRKPVKTISLKLSKDKDCVEVF